MFASKSSFLLSRFQSMTFATKNIKQLKIRIKSVDSIQKITKAMKMVSLNILS